MEVETELVFDTLYDRIRGDQTSCFTSNVAGESLLQSPASILPAIEKVLRETVEPALSVSGTNKIRDAALSQILGEYSSLGVQLVFRGLDYVLGAYLVVGARSDFARVASFLRTVSDTLLIEAISVIPVFFRRMDDGYNFGVSPEGEVKKFVLDLAKSHRKDVSIAATKVIEEMTHG